MKNRLYHCQTTSLLSWIGGIGGGVGTALFLPRFLVKGLLILLFFIAFYFLVKKKNFYFLVVLLFLFAFLRGYLAVADFLNRPCPQPSVGKIIDIAPYSKTTRLTIKGKTNFLVYTREKNFSWEEKISISVAPSLCLNLAQLPPSDRRFYFWLSQKIKAIYYYPPLQRKPAPPSFRQQLKLRQEEKISQNISYPASTLAKALLLGEKKDIPFYLKEKFSLLGLSHLLAISGLHLGIIYLLSFFIFLAGGLWRKQAFFLSFLVLWGYIFFIGAPASALRAGFMVSLIFSAYFGQRLVSLEQALLLSAAFLLFENPFFLLQLSFQFSYLALLGIIYFAPFFTKHLTPSLIPKTFAALFWATISAQISTAPLAIFYFGNFSFWSPLLNLLTVPFLPLLLFLGILFLLGLNFVSIVLDGLLNYILTIVQWSSALPLGNWRNIHLNAFFLFSYYLAFFFLVFYLSKKSKLKLKI